MFLNQSFEQPKNSRIRFNCVMKFVEIRNWDWDFVKLFGDQLIINIFNFLYVNIACIEKFQKV